MKNIDSILKASLSPDFSPSEELNNKILDSCTKKKRQPEKNICLLNHRLLQHV